MNLTHNNYCNILFLPFELFFREKILRGSLWLLIIYSIIELAILIIIFYFGGIGFETIIDDYSIILLIIVLAINFDLYFILYLSQLIRKNIPEIMSIDKSSNADKEIVDLFKHYIFNYKRLIIYIILVIILGETTFIILGLNIPSNMVILFFYFVLIPIAFGLCGIVISFAFGIWHCIYDIGQRDLIISVFHPDKLGGSKIIWEIAQKTTYIGSFLVVIYSLGAHYSPYLHDDLKRYAYLWVIFATLLLIISLFIPALSLRNILSINRNTAAFNISKIFYIIYNEITNREFINDSLADNMHNTLNLLNNMNNKIYEMQIWPYGNLAKKVTGIILMQGTPLLITNFNKIINLIR